MSTIVTKGRAIADSRIVSSTDSAITDENRLLIEGHPSWGEVAFLLAGDLVDRYSGVSVGHLKSIVTAALEIIENRALVSPATVLIPELGAGPPTSPDE